MKKILFINACVRPNSRTLNLAKAFLEKQEGEIEQVDLYQLPLEKLDLKGLKTRDKAVENNDFSSKSFDLAKQFASADVIVIAAPYWDMMFPSVLKTYLENITVCGLTFKYSQEGKPQGMCNAKSLHYITTAGGFIGEKILTYIVNSLNANSVVTVIQNCILTLLILIVFIYMKKKDRINGKELNVAGKTLSEYLATTNYDPKRIAVERNGDIVPKARYGETLLQDGDSVEVVSFVGGG